MGIKEAFTENKLTLGSVESFTGGLFASTITDIPGASQFFKGSLVTYATEEKIKLLGIKKELVDTYGVVSSECAVAMAEHGRKKLGVDVCVSFTGNAGPSAMEDKPVGLVYIAIAGPKGTKVARVQLALERNIIRQWCVSMGCSAAASYVEDVYGEAFKTFKND